MRKFFDPIINFFINNVLALSLFVGVGLLIIGYLDLFKIGEGWTDVFITAGSVILSSGVFMSIVKSSQFTTIFRNELRDIVYSEEHLGKRSDLEEIWEKVSEALCQQKFSAISKYLQKDIKKYYLPIDQEFYYKNYTVDLDIERDSSNHGYVNLTEETSTTLMADSTKSKFTYKFECGIPCPTDDDDRTKYILEEMWVNGKKVDHSKLLKNWKKDKISYYSLHYECVGSTEYRIVRKEKKRYSLDVNPYRAHRAAWLYENFYLDLNYPKDMDIEWIDMGVLGKWTKSRKDTSAFNRIKATYTGLIFRNQGFSLLFTNIAD